MLSPNQRFPNANTTALVSVIKIGRLRFGYDFLTFSRFVLSTQKRLSQEEQDKGKRVKVKILKPGKSKTEAEVAVASNAVVATRRSTVTSTGVPTAATPDSKRPY